MKIIIAIMTTVTCAVAAPNNPSEAAVSFLEKVRANTVNLEPGTDTALSPHTSKAKRREIASRLERMAQDLGNDPLEVGAVKSDGDLAAVLVRKISGFDPNHIQVFPIALVKQNDKWTAAPVPASFENSGARFAPDTRQRLKALEDWMLREQVIDLENLREQSAERMRRNIEEHLSPNTLRALNASQVAERFLDATSSRNRPVMLGLLGGLSVTPPLDWPLRMMAAERAASAGQVAASPWHLLMSENILRLIIQHNEDPKNASVTLACLDPSTSNPGLRLVQLDLSKSPDGLWRINLPSVFLQETTGAEDPTDGDLDADLLKAFPAKLRERYPTTPQPTAENAHKTLVSALNEGANMSPLMRLIPLEGPQANAIESCISASRVWWDLREPSSLRCAVTLDLQENQDHAAATVQCFSARNPDSFDLKVFYFTKLPDGWLWTPKPDSKLKESFQEWVDAQSTKWRGQWQDALLADCPVLEHLPDATAPSEEESRKLTESWLKAVLQGNLTAALRLTARLNMPDSKALLLKNLGYELSTARKYKSPPSIIGTYQDNRWSAVGTRVNSDKPFFPFYTIVASPSGARILPEIDLASSNQRSRDFLNKTSLKRLAETYPEAATQIQNLFSKHQSQVAAPAQP